jgi:hypothetical protein
MSATKMDGKSGSWIALKTKQATRRPERLVLKERQLLVAVSPHGGEGHELLRKLCLDSGTS